MSDVTTATRHRGGPLSREVIVDAAIGYLDDHGLPALSMRRLGERLGVEAMSLYRYVNGREDLLEAVVDRLVSRLHLEDGTRFGPADGWQAYLQWLAHAVRDLADEHPNAFPLVATRHPAAPWLRPPLRSLRVVEEFLENLTSRGFGDEAAVTAYRQFSSFLLGHLLLEVAGRGGSTPAGAEELDQGGGDVGGRDAEVDVADYPLLVRMRPMLSRYEADAEFEAALEDALDRIDRLVSS